MDTRRDHRMINRRKGTAAAWRQALAQSPTLLQRAGAIRAAISMDVSLNEIEEYLDRLDATPAETEPHRQASLFDAQV